MDFKFIFVGRCRENFILEGIKKYEKILKKYGKVKVVETKDDEKKIVSQIRKNSFLIILDLKGLEFSTENIAKKFLEWKNNGIFKFDFITGGPFGLSEKILKKSNFLWKLSDLTFNHYMVRLILMEQVYRICSILNNENYHH